MAGGSQEKTEQPTEKKLEDARKKGNTPKSKEISSVAVLFGGGIAALFTGRIAYERFRQVLEHFWENGFRPGIDGALAMDVAMQFLVIASPVLIATLVLSVAANVLQTKGFVFSLESIQPSFSKLNPLEGLKRMFSVRSLVELIKSVIKFALVTYVIYSVLNSRQGQIAQLGGMEPLEIGQIIGSIASAVLFRVCTIMLLLSVLDYWHQNWQFTKDLMMTKQEIKEEHKQAEGNPQIKSRIRSMQRALIRKRMMAQVPKATVVITNPTHYAVALFYAPKMEAPKVLAKGKDLIALKIIEIARKHRVPVHQNPPLARALYQQVEVDATIPVALYRAVAKVLAYIYQQKGGPSR